jgi:predicted DCC family thiol-disulfide oxidoreductase YuxK
MTDHPTILFDGTCGFCNAMVCWLIAHDQRGVMRFAPLQSPTGQRLLARFGMPLDYDRSLVLVESGRAYLSSTGSLRIARHLTWPVRLIAAFIVIPPFLRDATYQWVADHRYLFAGKTDAAACELSPPSARARFVDDMAA